jgi:hypothetical protein
VAAIGEPRGVIERVLTGTNCARVDVGRQGHFAGDRLPLTYSLVSVEKAAVAYFCFEHSLPERLVLVGPWRETAGSCFPLGTTQRR